ncbi:MAG: hypothetical protein ABI172_10840 [Ginsengibacter sp.]|jgi:hypothetical protein
MFQRKLKLLIVILAGSFIFCQNGNSASFIYPLPAPVLNNKIDKNDFLKPSVFVNLSSKEFTSLTGQKLSLIEKLYFKSVQRKLRRELKKNPDVIISKYYAQKTGKFELDPLWFIIGTIIGPVGVLFAFISKHIKAKRKNDIISAALGCVAFILWFGFLFVF